MIKRKGHYEFIRAWECPKEIKAFIASKFRGRVLNLCCGAWPCGHVNVDLKTTGTAINGNKIIQADVFADDLDFGEKFDTVFSDPPWNWPYDKRADFHNIIAKYIKNGGIFILNAPWLPRCQFFDVKDVYVIYRFSGLPANASLVSIAEYVGKEINEPGSPRGVDRHES